MRFLRAGRPSKARAASPRMSASMMKRAVIILLFLILLGGCLLLAAELAKESEPLQPLSLPANTPTPALVITPSGIVHAPTPGPQATPTLQPTEADDINILLLGTDQRIWRDPSWRTDTIILVAIRPRAKMVAMLSIPRDLWVNIPGHEMDRINVADYLGETTDGPGGGPRLLAATLQENLHIPIHGYVRINSTGLKQIIDSLGGITVNSDRAFDQWIDDYQGKRRHLQVVPGPQHMDGQTALGYARSRLTTNDLDRSHRQQQILLAIRDAALRPEVLPRLPGLLAALKDTVETDLSPGKILMLMQLAYQLEPAAYRTRVFDKTMVRDWVTPGGAMVLLPDHARIEQAWTELTAVQP